MTLKERKTSVMKHKLCFLCLRSKCNSKTCTSTFRCRINNCNGQHSSLLHPKEGIRVGEKSNSLSAPVMNEATVAIDENINSIGEVKPSQLLKVVPVLVNGSQRSVVVHALLDAIWMPQWGVHMYFSRAECCRRIGLRRSKSWRRQT